MSAERDDGTWPWLSYDFLDDGSIHLYMADDAADWMIKLNRWTDDDVRTLQSMPARVQAAREYVAEAERQISAANIGKVLGKRVPRLEPEQLLDAIHATLMQNDELRRELGIELLIVNVGSRSTKQ